MQNPSVNFIRLLVLVLFSSQLFTACAGSSPDKILESQAAERDTVTSTEPGTPAFDTLADDLANIIAGFRPMVYKNNNIADYDHFVYRAQVEHDWDLVVKHKTDPITHWRKKNVEHKLQDTGTLLYPFAGADFLYANTFFPDCRNYILIGLEPIGKFLRCDTLSKVATTAYLEKIRSALYYSNSLGFFRTESMQKDLNQSTLDGTLPLIAYYIKRTSHHISGITYFSLDSAGLQVKCTAEQSPVGVRVDFCDSLYTNNQSVYYLSFDLSDEHLKKHPELLAFVTSLAPRQTFLKAASYLMFTSGFRTMRKYLLDNVQIILQDDSGIPYGSFKPGKWEVQLFGTYTKTIDRFEHKFQPDLEKAYAEQETPHPVPFRIGYNVKFNETNLLLAKRKNPTQNEK